MITTIGKHSHNFALRKQTKRKRNNGKNKEKQQGDFPCSGTYNLLMQNRMALLKTFININIIKKLPVLHSFRHPSSFTTTSVWHAIPCKLNFFTDWMGYERWQKAHWGPFNWHCHSAPSLFPFTLLPPLPPPPPLPQLKTSWKSKSNHCRFRFPCRLLSLPLSHSTFFSYSQINTKVRPEKELERGVMEKVIIIKASSTQHYKSTGIMSSFFLYCVACCMRACVYTSIRAKSLLE